MIYLDHHAATPLSAPVRDALRDAHERAWANASSPHAAGRAARAVVERARRTIAAQVGVEAADLVFTAGGTEACNLALFGLCGRDVAGAHYVTSALEHPAIVEPMQTLTKQGADVTWLPLEGAAPPTPEALSASLRDETRLVSLQWVNHETGVVSPVAEYARICSARGVPLVVDASQALGKVPVDLGALGASAVVLASTKVGGPAGAAALWIRRTLPLDARVLGGGQERGRRAGTPDAAALAGFAAAVSNVSERLATMPGIAARRDRLERELVRLGAVVNAGAAPRVATVSNVSVPKWRAEILIAALDVEGLCASAGAACSSGVGEPSPVLRALYPNEPWRAESALRLSLGPETTDDEIAAACAIVQRVLGRGP